tara:strand:+ start:78 stop:461 length:384 start_codon:yes stop_codon:yes gene_type:complete
MTADPRIKIPLMMAKPVLKKFRQLVEKRNKVSKELNVKSSKNMKDLNKAQQRLDVSKEYTRGVTELMKKKLPPSAMKILRKGFDEVVKKRNQFRNAVAESTGKKLAGRKPNFKGGLVKKPRLAKRGF